MTIRCLPVNPTHAHRVPRSWCQNIAPRLRAHHHGIREHAAVPADMFESASRSCRCHRASRNPHLDDIHLAVRIVGQAVASGLIVRARAFDRAVVLSDVKIDRPGAQCVGQLAKRVVRCRVRQSKSCGRMRSLGRVVAERDRAGCAPCRPGSRASWGGPPFPAARPCASSHAFRPSRFRLRRRAVRRSPRRWCMPREMSPRCALVFSDRHFRPNPRGPAAESIRTTP